MLNQALLSNTLGWLSILCWLGAQFPQVIVNFKTKSVEGLALPFLANWLFGDITNLVGCILTQQLPFQTYLAGYFVSVDLSLVAQYIYYYKPAPSSASSTPCRSRSPSPTATIIMSPTPYSLRNLTRPSSRTPLLTAGEIEAGFGSAKYRSTSHTSVRSHRRPATAGSSRFTGVSAAYPPAGLLPSADEVLASGSGTLRGPRSASKQSKHSFASLRRQMEESRARGHHNEKGKLKHKDKGTHEKDHTDIEGDDELSGLTDSFYSEVSQPSAGVRRVSWSQAPPVVAPLSTVPSPGEGEGEATPVNAANTPTPQGILQAAANRSRTAITAASAPDISTSEAMSPTDDIRQRSRSRGRTMSRPSPITITPANISINIEETPTSEGAHGLRSQSSSRLPAEQILLMEQVDQSLRRGLGGRARASTSGSSRRSASIVFLSLGLGGFVAFGRDGLTGIRTSLKGMAQSGSSPIGRVLNEGNGFDLLHPNAEDTLPQALPPSEYGTAWMDSLLGEGPSSSSNGRPQKLPQSGPPKSKSIFTSQSSLPQDEEDPEDDTTFRSRRPHDPPPLTREQKRRLIGRISAWACTILYLTSRLPQIWKNYTRKSVQGLSLALFVFAFLGNTFYVASILSSPVLWEYPSDGKPNQMVDLSSLPLPLPTELHPLPATGPFLSGFLLSPEEIPQPQPSQPIPPYRTPRAQAFLRESLPYLLGSAGTLCFDVVIVSQGIIYGRREREAEEDEEDDEDDEEAEEEEDEEEEEEREGRAEYGSSGDDSVNSKKGLLDGRRRLDAKQSAEETHLRSAG